MSVAALELGNANLPLVNPTYQRIVDYTVRATGLAVVALFCPWESISIIGMTVLTGISYGIANDMIACRDCIEYFTIGHRYDGRELRNRPLNTLDPNLNAVAWGAIATWHVSAFAGIIFALLARIPFWGLALKITTAQLAPYLAIGAVIILLVSHFNSRAAQQEMENNPFERYENVPLDMQARWEGCSIRNLTGYLSLGVGGVALSIAIIVVRTGVFGI